MRTSTTCLTHQPNTTISMQKGADRDGNKEEDDNMYWRMTAEGQEDCNSGGGVMLRTGRRARDSGDGSGCNTMPPKPLGGDFLFAPLLVGLPIL